MNKTKILTILLLIAISISCKKEKIIYENVYENGVAVSLKPLWKTSLHLNGSVSNGIIDNSIIYNNNILIPTTNGGTNMRLSMINTNDGSYMWHWDDRFDKIVERSGIYFHYQYNNLVTWQNGKKSYCINLENGTTNWKYERNNNFEVRVQGIDDKFYSSIDNLYTPNIDTVEDVLYMGSMQDGNITEYLKANLFKEYIDDRKWIGGITFINKTDNSSNVLVQYAEPLPNWYYNTFYGLYNTDSNKWIWERSLLATPQLASGTYHAPIIKGDRIYQHISNSVVSHKVSTGEKLWQKDFNGDFMFSGIIVEDDKIIANCEDTYTYCLNVNTGHTIWKLKTSGTCSRMSYMNGIVYFVGGSSTRLHAIDVNTGKMKWNIDASRLGEEEGSHMKTNAVYTIPAQNGQSAKVIALSHKYAYCFKAVQ